MPTSARSIRRYWVTEIQLEIGGGAETTQTLLVKCDCRKKKMTVVVMRPGIDPRFYYGKCPRCNKEHFQKIDSLKYRP